jgi:tetratricopeptide (TPR) repeat protein
MYRYHESFRLIFCLLLSVFSACSSGPAEKPVPDAIASPAYLLDQGVQHYRENNYAKAIDEFDKALLQYRSIDDQTGIATSCLNLANSYMAINNNATAAAYLMIANTVIEQASLTALDDYLRLLYSSLAINNASYDEAQQEVKQVLDSEDTGIQLAALQNRTVIAFAKNDDDKTQWLDQYRTLQQEHAEIAASHEARVLRFEAELADEDSRKKDLLSASLAISRKLADRPAIAAGLMQWAEMDIAAENFTDAEDKCLRALYIRHHLGDVKNTLLILEKLQAIYAKTHNVKQQQAADWIAKLTANDLAGWQQLFADFDNYPVSK